MKKFALQRGKQNTRKYWNIDRESYAKALHGRSLWHRFRLWVDLHIFCHQNAIDSRSMRVKRMKLQLLAAYRAGNAVQHATAISAEMLRHANHNNFYRSLREPFMMCSMNSTQFTRWIRNNLLRHLKFHFLIYDLTWLWRFVQTLNLFLLADGEEASTN